MLYVCISTFLIIFFSIQEFKCSSFQAWMCSQPLWGAWDSCCQSEECPGRARMHLPVPLQTLPWASSLTRPFFWEPFLDFPFIKPVSFENLACVGIMWEVWCWSGFLFWCPFDVLADDPWRAICDTDRFDHTCLNTMMSVLFVSDFFFIMLYYHLSFTRIPGGKDVRLS